MDKTELNILIVDDQQANLDLLDMAVGNDYQTTLCDSGEKALELMGSKDLPDLILLDVHMPDISGFEVMDKIKTNEKAKEIPVIFITGSVSRDDEVKGLDLGAVDYIFKPINVLSVKMKVQLHMELVQKRHFVDTLIKDQMRLIQKTMRDYQKVSTDKEQIIRDNLILVQENEERLRLALEASEIELWDWNIKSSILHKTNKKGDTENSSCTDLTNIHCGDQHIYHKDAHKFSNVLSQHFCGSLSSFDTEYRVLNGNNNERWFHIIGKVTTRGADGSPLRMVGTLKDITRRRKNDEQSKLIARSFSNTSDGVWIADKNLQVILINESYSSITGYTAEEIVGKHIKISHSVEGEKLTHAYVMHRLQSDSNIKLEILDARKDGTEFIKDLRIDTVTDEDGEIAYFLGVFSDITVRKKNEQDLVQLANYDSLTNLPNRSLFLDRVARLISMENEGESKFAILFIDVDNFKNINDSLGHDVGDRLLKLIGERLNDCRRSRDTVSRLGGDEFTFIVEGIKRPDVAAKVAQRILDAFEDPFIFSNFNYEISCSIGISIYPEDGLTVKELTRNADTAMYCAKESGKCGFQFFAKEMNTVSMKRLKLESQLRDAIKNEKLEVYFQPKVNLKTGSTIGMECLCRWYNGEDGFVSPDVFIAIAEESALIIPLGELVLRMACQITKKWFDDGLISGRVAVNLSARQFLQPNLLDRIDSIIRNCCFSPKNLEFEITEGTVMRDAEKAIEIMHELKNREIALSIDDFGTGYSSLNYLKNFPINFLKIDKAFVSDMLSSKKGLNIVTSIINMAHSLDLKIVAEGVETIEEAKALSSLDAEEVQGYLYSKPLPPDEFEALLSERSKLNFQ